MKKATQIKLIVGCSLGIVFSLVLFDLRNSFSRHADGSSPANYRLPEMAEQKSAIATEPRSAQQEQEQAAQRVRDEEEERWRDSDTRNAEQPDPAVPVPKDQIGGKWWLGPHHQFKTYAFVEGWYPTRVSLPSGQALALECWGSEVPRETPSDKAWHFGECAPLPLHQWVRVSMGELSRAGIDTPVSGWGFAVTQNGSTAIDFYNVTMFCDNRRCKSSAQAAAEWLAADADRKRRGEQ